MFPYAIKIVKTTAKALYDTFLHYGFPQRLHSNQGRHFESRVIKELSQMAGIEKSRTTPYHPMGCAKKIKANWKAYVPTLVHAYNETRNEASESSPFYLVFGKHSRLPIDLALGVESNERQARFVEIDYRRRSSVTTMLERLYWVSLATGGRKPSS